MRENTNLTTNNLVKDSKLIKLNPIRTHRTRSNTEFKSCKNQNEIWKYKVGEPAPRSSLRARLGYVATKGYDSGSFTFLAALLLAATRLRVRRHDRRTDRRPTTDDRRPTTGDRPTTTRRNKEAKDSPSVLPFRFSASRRRERENDTRKTHISAPV